jgi:ADP-ribose pyrophosphatase
MSAPAGTVFEDAPESWPVESTTEVFRNWLIGIRNDEVRIPAGGVAQRSVVTHPGAVSVLALDDAGRALMIRQYRHPVGRLLWELPAGLRDRPGEPLVDAAKRELLEETGYRAATWHTLIDHYSSPGFTTERVRIFLARDLRPASEDDQEPGFVREDEEALIVTAWLPLRDAVPAILAGKLHNGHTIAGLLAGHVAWSQGFRDLRPADAPELRDLPGLPDLQKSSRGSYCFRRFPWGTTGDRHAPTSADSRFRLACGDDGLFDGFPRAIGVAGQPAAAFTGRRA